MVNISDNWVFKRFNSYSWLFDGYSIVSEFQGFKVTEFQGFKVTAFLRLSHVKLW